MVWIILFIVILLVLVFLYFYFAVLKTQFFIIDKSAILDNRLIEILTKIPADIKLLLPQIILDNLEQKIGSDNLVEAEIAKKGIENFHTLKNLENVKLKIYKSNQNSDDILKIAKEYNCKILTTDFDLYMKAKIEKIKILNINDIGDIFNKNLVLGDTITVYLAARERYDGISYLYDGTKIIVLNAADHLEKKVVCKIFKISKDMSENKVFTRFLRIEN